MNNIVLVVESPNKAKTIQKYFPNFKVLATAGHIKDLPEKEIGVDEDLNLKFVYIKGKKEIVERIKKHAKGNQVLVATDPDREGEAIAYHLIQELKLKGKCRVRFHEVVKDAIERAIKEVDNVDMSIVKAQFARRALDRLVGYPISAELQRSLKEKGLSAGRVQSAVLYLIYLKEEEVKKFKERIYYVVVADFGSFKAVSNSFDNEEKAKELQLKAQKGLKVLNFLEKKVSISASKPFTTSELQSVASQKLRMGVAQIQAEAQRLFEEGYITYPRTDVHRMNEKKAQEFMEYINKTFGDKYVGKLRQFKEKETSQGAHECIRITSLEAKVPSKLYEIIYRRTLSSLMADAVVLRQKAIFEYDFKAEGEKLLFEGWSKMEPMELKKELPKLKVGEVLKPLKVYVEKRKTEPPPFYTQASLVKKIEALGIGRPSTYASTIATLLKRGYVKEVKKSLRLTEKGERVINYLKSKYPLLLSSEFTAKMEKLLDEVAEGKTDYKRVVKELLESLKTPVLK